MLYHWEIKHEETYFLKLAANCLLQQTLANDGKLFVHCHVFIWCLNLANTRFSFHSDSPQIFVQRLNPANYCFSC